MPVINVDHLLDQADRLAAAPAAGAPRQADLRRAISTSYYALFHTVLTAAADDLVGQAHRQTPRYALIYRSVDHGKMRALCEDIKKSNLPKKYTRYEPQGGFGPDFVDVAAAVLDLQEKRHLADYDPLFLARRSDAVLAIVTSRAAIERFRNAPRTQRKTFLSLVVFSPR